MVCSVWLGGLFALLARSRGSREVFPLVRGGVFVAVAGLGNWSLCMGDSGGSPLCMSCRRGGVPRITSVACARGTSRAREEFVGCSSHPVAGN